MAVHGIIIPGNGSVTHGWAPLPVLLATGLLYPISLTMLINIYASRWRLLIPVLVGAAVAVPIIVDTSSLTLHWIPSSRIVTATAGALWTTYHLTLSGALLAAITFVFFMGGNIMNLKLSRDSLDVAMTETSRELADIKMAFNASQQGIHRHSYLLSLVHLLTLILSMVYTNHAIDNLRLWQLIDCINQVRPLPRTSATVAAVSMQSAAGIVTSNYTTTATIITHDRETSSPTPMGFNHQSLPKGGSISPKALTSPTSTAAGLSMAANGATPKSHIGGPRSSAYAPTSAASNVPLTNVPITSATTVMEQEISITTNSNMVTTMVPALGTTLKQLASHPACLELLKDASQAERSIENLMFWLDAGRFETLSSPDERRRQAAAIFLTFIGADAPHQVNLSSVMSAHISRAVTAGVAPRDLFAVARTEIGNLITTNVLPRFLRSASHDVALQFINHLSLPSRQQQTTGGGPTSPVSPTLPPVPMTPPAASTPMMTSNGSNNGGAVHVAVSSQHQKTSNATGTSSFGLPHSASH
jgi:hypothetical protein